MQQRGTAPQYDGPNHLGLWCQMLFDAASHTQFHAQASNREMSVAGDCELLACDETDAVHTCKKDGEFITVRFYNKDGVESTLPNTGFTCNSYLTFSTTNWNTWQTLDVIAVNDDTDEGPERLSEIAFLVESVDWYYNSDGASLLTAHNERYHPIEDARVADYTVDLSMFDTRFGRHINRYPTVATEDDFSNATNATADRVEAHHAVDAANQVKGNQFLESAMRRAFAVLLSGSMSADSRAFAACLLGLLLRAR